MYLYMQCHAIYHIIFIVICIKSNIRSYFSETQKLNWEKKLNSNNKNHNSSNSKYNAAFPGKYSRVEIESSTKSLEMKEQVSPNCTKVQLLSLEVKSQRDEDIWEKVYLWKIKFLATELFSFQGERKKEREREGGWASEVETLQERELMKSKRGGQVSTCGWCRRCGGSMMGDWKDGGSGGLRYTTQLQICAFSDIHVTRDSLTPSPSPLPPSLTDTHGARAQINQHTVNKSCSRPLMALLHTNTKTIVFFLFFLFCCRHFWVSFIARFWVWFHQFWVFLQDLPAVPKDGQ